MREGGEVASLLVAAEQAECSVLFSQKVLFKACKIALITPSAQWRALDGHNGEVDVGGEAEEAEGAGLEEGGGGEEGGLVEESPCAQGEGVED